MVNRTQQVNVPAEVFSKVQRRVEKTQFQDVDTYVTFILEEVIYYTDEPDRAADSMTDEELRMRLKSLGYLKDE